MRSVDVLIPFHSDSEYLWEAIDSILDSRGVAVRILLINDIEDAEVSSKFQLQIERYLNITDANYLILRNLGRSYATSLNVSRAWIQSDFVAILNSDDLSTPFRLQSQVQALEKSGAELAVGKIVKFQGKLRLPSMSGALNPSSFRWQHLLLGAYGSDASVVVTREAWFEHFTFDEHSCRSDWVTALKMYQNLKIIGVDQAVYKYRIHGRQVTQTQISDDFSSNFSFWRGLSTSLGLPEVSINISRALSQPWAKQRLDKDEFKTMQEWCLKFEKLLFDTSVSNKTKLLLDRRLIISGPIIFSLTQRPLLLTRMVFEYLYIRIIGSRTRS